MLKQFIFTGNLMTTVPDASTLRFFPVLCMAPLRYDF